MISCQLNINDKGWWKSLQRFHFCPKDSIDSISIIISCLIFDNFLLTLYRIVST